MMSTTTIRVPTKTKETLHILACTAGLSMQQVLDQALEVYRRQQLLEATNAAYAALRLNAKAWHEFEEERRDWDATLADGLERVE